MRRFALAGAAVAFVAVLVRSLSGASGPLHELSRAAPARSFAPRLSISIPYRTCTTLPERDNETVPREDCGPAQDAVVDVLEFEAGGESAAPDSLRVAALAALIWWDKTEDGSLDEAIARLDRARRLTLDPVPALVDLSGAYLVRAERTQNSHDLYDALEHAREALEHEPRNLPALWNAALATQAIGLDVEASEAWDAYLAVDRRSEWAAEAQRRKRALITRPVEPRKPLPGASTAEVQAFAATHPQEARKHGWGPILGGWGKAVEMGDTVQAALHLALAEGLGHALKKRVGGDASLADAVRDIHDARGNPEAIMTLARAHRAFGASEALLTIPSYAAAGDSLGDVVPARALSPVLAQWTDLSQAVIVGSSGKNEAAAAALLRLLTHVDSARHPALAGGARMTLGTVLGRMSRYDQGREQYRAAAEHFRRAGESERLGALQSTHGETACQLGDTIEAYRLLHGAQRALRPHRRSTSLHNTLHGLARCVITSEMPRAARIILDEDVSVARLAHPSIKLMEAFQLRAHARALAGDSAGAEADLDSASAALIELPKDPEQMRWAVSVLRTAALGPVSAEKMDSAVAHLLAKNVTWGLPALVRRADARLAQGDVSGATADLETIVSHVRRLSSSRDAALRAAMMEQARSRFDRLVMLYLRAGKNEEALRTLERGRVSFAAVRDSAAASGTGRLTAPAGQVALEYALIGDTLLTWVVQGESIHLERRVVDRDEFVLAVEQTGAALESPAREAGAQSGLRRLYDWLIGPVRNRLGPPETPLVILADGEVAGVPFAVLLDSRDQHLLVDHPISYAATLADAARRWPASRGSAGPVLLVADPAFDQHRHPTLDRLGGARREVDSLQRLFPGAVRLDSVHATRAAFVEKAQSASLIHYAGHAIFDDARPERSFLVLAGADTTGRLAAETVSGMRLGGVRLVVLSACRTLRSRGGRSGGFAGLSGALLSAGAGGVVGSLWQVRDGHAQPLMMAFHREYQRLGDPALALREAQLQMLRSGGSLGTWAGFRYTGN